ncbi:SCP2 sterol-binding domain-containing protein [Rhodocyclaceae bacterium]
MLPHPATAILAALNHLLQGNDWARQRLAPYAGRQALIEMPPFQVGFVVTEAGSVVQMANSVTPDVTITMPADSPFRLLDGFERLIGAARVDGNAEFATELSFVFRNLRWDAAEDLSQIFGDVAAQRIVQATHGFFRLQKQAASNFYENVSEYLAYENKTLLTRREFESFSASLSQLDTFLSSIEQRISQVGESPSDQRRLS